MAFPSSPVNNQYATVGGITYQYNSTKTAWIRVSVTGNQDLVANTLRLTSSTTSTSTSTGALRVDGGAGIIGNLTVGGNISVNSGSYFLGDGSKLTGISTNPTVILNGTSNVAILGPGSSITANVNGSIITTIASTGVTVNGVINTTGNVLAAAVTATNLTGTLQTASQTNITAVGTLSSLNVTGNILSGLINTTGVNASGTVYANAATPSTSATTGALILPTGGVAVGGNLAVVGNINLTTAGVIGGGGNILINGVAGAIGQVLTQGTTGVYWSTVAASGGGGNYSNVNLIAYLAGGISSTGFINTSGNVSAAILTGGAVNVSGNVQTATVNATNLFGTIQTAAQTNITSVGTLTSLNVTGNVLAASHVGGSVNVSGNVLAAAVNTSVLTIGATGYANASTTTTSTTSGALVIPTGGLGVAGNIAVGSGIYLGASQGTSYQILTSGGLGQPASWQSFDTALFHPDGSYKKLVRVATTGANIGLVAAAPNTLDGVTLAANDRILVKDQLPPALNGIYYVSTLGTGANGTWTRTLDADATLDIDGATVGVSEGTVNGGRRFQTYWKGTDTLGTTGMYWNRVADVNASSNIALQTTAVGIDIATPSDLVTMATGAVTDLAVNSIGARALQAVAASTYTRAHSLYVAGAPTAGTNATITNSYAVYVASGATSLGGNLAVAGNINLTTAGTIGGGGNILINGVAGTLGQVLTQGGAGVYWSTVTAAAANTNMLIATAGGSNVTVSAGNVNVSINSSNVASFGTQGLSILTTAASTSTITGALQVAGGIGVQGTVFAGQLNTTGNLQAAAVTATNLTGTLQTAAQTNITSVGTLASLNVTGNVLAAVHSGGSINVSGNVLAASVNTTGLNASGTVYANAATASTSITTGAFILPSGGLGVGGNIALSGNINLTTAGVIGGGGNILINGVAGTIGQVLTQGTTGVYWATAAGGSFSSTDDTSTAATYYPIVATTAGGSTAKTSSGKLTFVPSTGTLSATIFTSLSDEATKKDIQPITNALNIVENLRGVTFNWRDGGAPSAGLIAQDVEKYLPELVATSEDAKTLNYNGVIGVLVEAIKEQNIMIKSLNERIQTLEGK